MHDDMIVFKVTALAALFSSCSSCLFFVFPGVTGHPGQSSVAAGDNGGRGISGH